MDRRTFLLTSASAMLLGGCATSDSPWRPTSADGPPPVWPGRDQPNPRQADPRPIPTYEEPVVHHPEPSIHPAEPDTPASPSTVAALTILPRSKWADAAPNPARLNPMGGVERITIHHEGWTTVGFTDQASTALRLETIRQGHLKRMGAGDIGYHFIIDRAGRLWQGRPLQYQGAHVRGHNPKNLGVMVLGNFEKQNPSKPQVITLRNTLRMLMQHYNVPVSRVHTHRELGPTACPGRHLQPVVTQLRRGRYLA